MAAAVGGRKRADRQLLDPASLGGPMTGLVDKWTVPSHDDGSHDEVVAIAARRAIPTGSGSIFDDPEP